MQPTKRPAPAPGTLGNIMKQTRIFLAVFIVISHLFSCNQPTIDQKWDSVKDSRDFAEFFNYGLGCRDSALLEKCYDSLTRYLPSECCTILFSGEYYYPGYEDPADQKFRLTDECDREIDMKVRNILFIRIDSLDNTEIHYQNKSISNTRDFIPSIYNSDEDSFDLPEIKPVHIDDSIYFTRSFVIFIYTEMLRTDIHRTSWEALYNVVHELSDIYDEVKEIKANSLYQASYNKITRRQQMNIDLLRSKNIVIHFCLLRIPPKPPPPHNPYK